MFPEPRCRGYVVHVSAEDEHLWLFERKWPFKGRALLRGLVEVGVAFSGKCVTVRVGFEASHAQVLLSMTLRQIPVVCKSRCRTHSCLQHHMSHHGDKELNFCLS